MMRSIGALPGRKPSNGRGIDIRPGAETGDRMPFDPSAARHTSTVSASGARADSHATRPMSIYAYGLTRQRLEQAARRLRLPLNVVDDVAAAQALVTLKSYYRRHQRPISDAEERGMPIYVLRSNTITQMENFLAEVFDLDTEVAPSEDAVSQAVRETQSAIEAVLNGSRTVDLSPQAAPVRRRQHELAREANLVSHSYGKEPYRRVRIFRE